MLVSPVATWKAQIGYASRFGPKRWAASTYSTPGIAVGIGVGLGMAVAGGSDVVVGDAAGVRVGEAVQAANRSKTTNPRCRGGVARLRSTCPGSLHAPLEVTLAKSCVHHLAG